MKTATVPSLRVDPELQQAVEKVLQKGENLSSFVVQSIRENVERRQLQSEFVARGLRSRNSARRSGKYVDADTVVGRLEEMLKQAKRARK